MADDTPLLVMPIRRAHDVVCVGTALVDLLADAPVERVVELGLHPGTMTLVDGEHAEAIGAGLQFERAVSGGTTANTAVGIAALGGHPAFIGAVAADELGRQYGADLNANHVRAALETVASEDPMLGTGACRVIVTPDSERTMATTLGVSGLLSSGFVARSGIVRESGVVYFDAYLLDFPEASPIVETILETATSAGTRVAFGLADPFAVERHRDTILGLLPSTDLVFGNEEEALAISKRADLSSAIELLGELAPTTVITRGPRGAIITSDGDRTEIEAIAVDEVRDVTGAGDLFASGVLYGAVKGFGAAKSGRLGALLAAEIIGHLGARPEADLSLLAKEAGLL